MRLSIALKRFLKIFKNVELDKSKAAGASPRPTISTQRVVSYQFALRIVYHCGFAAHIITALPCIYSAKGGIPPLQPQRFAGTRQQALSLFGASRFEEDLFFSSRRRSYLRRVWARRANVTKYCRSDYISAITSTSTSAPFGSAFAATQLRAGFSVKYFP